MLHQRHVFPYASCGSHDVKLSLPMPVWIVQSQCAHYQKQRARQPCTYQQRDATTDTNHYRDAVCGRILPVGRTSQNKYARQHPAPACPTPIPASIDNRECSLSYTSLTSVHLAPCPDRSRMPHLAPVQGNSSKQPSPRLAVAEAALYHDSNEVHVTPRRASPGKLALGDSAQPRR